MAFLTAIVIGFGRFHHMVAAGLSCSSVLGFSSFIRALLFGEGVIIFVSDFHVLNGPLGVLFYYALLLRQMELMVLGTTLF